MIGSSSNASLAKMPGEVLVLRIERCQLDEPVVPGQQRLVIYSDIEGTVMTRGDCEPQRS